MTADQATVGAFIVVGLGALAASARWLLPRLSRFFGSLDKMFETINGKPAKVDKAGREEEPAVPSLSVQLADLRRDIVNQHELGSRITILDQRVTAIEADVTGRLDRIEAGGQIERLAAKAESVQAFRAIEAIANQGEKPDDN